MVKDRFTKQLWIGGGIIIGSIIVAAVAMGFFSGSLSDQANAIATARATVQTNTDAVGHLAQLKGQVPQAAQYQAAIDQLLPNQYGLVTFPQWLSDLGAKYNVTANAAFQGSVVPSAGTTAGVAQFSFTADGPLSDLTAFLDGMNAKSSNFLVTLTSFDMTNDGTNEKVTGQGTLFFH